MPVSTLVTTAGAFNANAYASVANADQYHLDRPAVGTTWSAATTDQKSAAILWATKLLDRMFIWNGYIINELQALMWPRYGLYELNGYTQLDPLTIPEEIQWATAEYSRQLLTSDKTGDSPIQTMGITSLKAGPIAFAFKDPVYSKPVPDIVVNLIPANWGYLLHDNGIGERELMRS